MINFLTEKELINMTEKEWIDLYTSGQCSTCIYKTGAFYYSKRGRYMCGYCLKTGSMRNSLPPNCNKYQKRKRRHKKRYKHNK